MTGFKPCNFVLTFIYGSCSVQPVIRIVFADECNALCILKHKSMHIDITYICTYIMDERTPTQKAWNNLFCFLKICSVSFNK